MGNFLQTFSWTFTLILHLFLFYFSRRNTCIILKFFNKIWIKDFTFDVGSSMKLLCLFSNDAMRSFDFRLSNSILSYFLEHILGTIFSIFIYSLFKLLLLMMLLMLIYPFCFYVYYDHCTYYLGSFLGSLTFLNIFGFLSK